MNAICINSKEPWTSFEMQLSKIELLWSIDYAIGKGAFKYYVIKEVGGWVGQMMMFDDKVGWWEWLNDDVIKK